MSFTWDWNLLGCTNNNDEEYKFTTGGELVKWMAKKNDELKEVYTSGDVMDGGKKVSENALKKAKKHEFYLGLESTWLYK
mmetsp:Transcript_10576/g.21128  ORF Transcript_10576/g.21128 Transcript_10576/m.21128 type:complete len:80 (+) Transcript_10576:125-364(+)